MYRKWFLLAGVVDLFILSILDKIAFHYYLYWRYPLFDVLMHLIGGVAIGLVSAFVFLELQREKISDQVSKAEESEISLKLFYLLNLIFIVSIGIGWEFFEIWADRIVQFDPVNILQDISVGIVGSLSAGLIVLWIHNYNLRRLK